MRMETAHHIVLLSTHKLSFLSIIPTKLESYFDISLPYSWEIVILFLSRNTQPIYTDSTLTYDMFDSLFWCNGKLDTLFGHILSKEHN